MNVLALDIGLKRIGVAFAATGVAVAQEAIQRKNRNQAAREVKERLAAYKIETLVIGIPIGGSSEEEMRRRTAHFVKLLEFEGTVHFQDESFSSCEAEEMMQGAIKNRRDGKSDSLAALIILQRWCENNKNLHS